MKCKKSLSHFLGNRRRNKTKLKVYKINKNKKDYKRETKNMIKKTVRLKNKLKLLDCCLFYCNFFVVVVVLFVVCILFIYNFIDW